MTLVAGFTDSSPGGSAGSPKTGDLSGAITAGSTDAFIRITNTGDNVCNLYWRKTGATDYDLMQLSPQTSQDRLLSLTVARTMEYYFDASALKVEVAYFFGTGLTSTISVSDVTAWIEMLGYTVGATGNLTSAEVQLCIDDISAELNLASTRYGLIAMHTLNITYKNRILLKGAVMQALSVLKNIGASRGLTSDMIITASETSDRYRAEYDSAMANITTGLNLGA